MSKKILVVDDSKTIRQQVSFALSKGGYQVVEATDGRNGISVLKENLDVVAIICDVNMPLMSGLEMVIAISKDPELTKYPIIMLTTEGGRDSILQAKEAGARGWVIKPFNPDDLLSIITKLAV